MVMVVLGGSGRRRFNAILGGFRVFWVFVFCWIKSKFNIADEN